MQNFAAASCRRARLSCRLHLQPQCHHRSMYNSNHRSHRWNSSNSSSEAFEETVSDRNKRFAIYAVALTIVVTGSSYAAVPLYKAFCQATGYGGTTQKATEEKFKNMKPVEGARQITVNFNADTSASMPWRFKPQQKSVKVVPGETALAFYTAHNPTGKPVTGVSTYNISPMKAGLYFNKIQCFCFEEQRLRPHEEIDMPVFFYVDPAFLDDPAMNNVQSLTLSYTFFRTGEQEVLTPDLSDAQKAKLQAMQGEAPPVGTGMHLGGGQGEAEVLKGDAAAAKIKKWTEEVASKTGVKLHGNAAMPQPVQ